MNLNHYLNSIHSKQLILNSNAITVLTVAILYFGLAKTGFIFTSVANPVAPLFLATGLALACVIIVGKNALIGVWIGSFLANFTNIIQLHSEEGSYLLFALSSFIIATASTVGAGISSRLVLRICNGLDILHNGKTVLVLLVIGSNTFSIIASTFGVFGLTIAGFSKWENFLNHWFTWWLSDTVGAIILSPFILAWYYKDSYKFKTTNLLELLFLVLLTIAFCVLVFFYVGELKYLLIPLAIGTAYRFGIRITSTLIVFITLFSAIVTNIEIGPFAKLSIIDSILYLDLFIGVIVLCGLFFAATIAERKRAENLTIISEKKLRKNQDILQATIDCPKGVSIFSIGLNYEYLSFNSLHKINMRYVFGAIISLGISLDKYIKNKNEFDEISTILNKVFKGENITFTKHYKQFDIYWEFRLSPIRKTNNEIIGATIVTTNITEIIYSQKALKESEERFRTIFENIQDLVFQTDPIGIILNVSPSVTDITEYTSEELIGKSSRILQTDDEEHDTVIKLINERQIISNFEHLLKTKSGKVITVSVNAKMIFDQNGNKHHIDGILRDITQIKEKEKEIEYQNLRLNIQNKELEQFAYITSHDLQEPLLTLKCFADLLKEEFPNNANSNIKQYLDFMLESSNRMQILVKGLLDYSRIGKQIEVSKVDCNQIVSLVLDSEKETIQAINCQITTGPLPTIKGYSVDLIQLFQHLLKNAFKFRKKDTPLEIHISATLKVGFWEFVVSDNGIGIHESNIEKIFVIFKRLNNREEYAGIGIGLAVCKKIVAIHGGEIWAESKLGEGTSIHFTIPVK